MNIPKKIRIAGIIYDVRFDEIEIKDLRGRTDFSKQLILLHPGKVDAVAQTFLHEIIHCINNELGEVTVDSIAVGIYQVIKDNPKLFK